MTVQRKDPNRGTWAHPADVQAGGDLQPGPVSGDSGHIVSSVVRSVQGEKKRFLMVIFFDCVLTFCAGFMRSLSFPVGAVAWGVCPMRQEQTKRTESFYHTFLPFVWLVRSGRLWNQVLRTGSGEGMYGGQEKGHRSGGHGTGPGPTPLEKYQGPSNTASSLLVINWGAIQNPLLVG